MKKHKKQDSLNLFAPPKRKSAVPRNTRFATSIKKIIADTIIKNDFPTRDRAPSQISSTLVTVTHVHVTEDLRHVTIYISPMNTELADMIIDFYNNQKHYFKDILAKQAFMRYIPDINFTRDTSYENARRIEELLSIK